MSDNITFTKDLGDEFMRLPMINTSESSKTSTISDDESNTCITSSAAFEIITAINNQEDVPEEECVTPKSPKNMIPAILSCPPAPKKPRPVASRKRSKVGGLKFIQVVSKEEIETFFRTVELGFNGGPKRKRAM